MSPLASSSSNLLARSKFWTPITTRPNHEALSTFFTSQCPFSSHSLVDLLEVDILRDTKILVDPSANKGKSIFLAVPFKVTDRASNVFGKMHGGMSATLIDVITSMHMCEQTLPKTTMHVTTSLSIKYMSVGSQNTPLIALSQIDKMGKRLIYSQMKIIEDPTNEVLDNWIQTNYPETTTNSSSAAGGKGGDTPLIEFPHTAAVQEFVKLHSKVVTTGQHIKMFVDVPIGGK